MKRSALTVSDNFAGDPSAYQKKYCSSWDQKPATIQPAPSTRPSRSSQLFSARHCLTRSKIAQTIRGANDVKKGNLANPNRIDRSHP